MPLYRFRREMRPAELYEVDHYPRIGEELLLDSLCWRVIGEQVHPPGDFDEGDEGPEHVTFLCEPC